MAEDSFHSAAWVENAWKRLAAETNRISPGLEVKAHGEHAVWVMHHNKKIGWIEIKDRDPKPWKLHLNKRRILAFSTFDDMHHAAWTFCYN